MGAVFNEVDAVGEVCCDDIEGVLYLSGVAECDVCGKSEMLEIFRCRAYHTWVEVVASGLDAAVCGGHHDGAGAAARVEERVAWGGDQINEDTGEPCGE